MGEEDYLGPLLVADFICNYLMGSFFACLVVGCFPMDADGAIEDSLYLVA